MTKERGFGSMDPKKQKEIASKGGHASQEKGGGFSNMPKEKLHEVAKKGGEHSHGGRKKGT